MSRTALTSRLPSVVLVVVILAVGLLPGAVGATRIAGAEPAAAILEEEDGRYIRLYKREDPSARAWLYRAMRDEEDEGTKADLVVALHGAGGHPKNFVLPRLMEQRESWCLAVAGRRAVRTKRGAGFLWDGAGVAHILEFVEYVLATYPIDPDRVLVWGHSAGGAMTLAALASAPGLFAGGLTTASSAAPDARHRARRVCVFLGTEDPNWALAPSVRSHLEGLASPAREEGAGGKGNGGACAFFAVEDLEHDIPYDDYLDLGFEWILHGRARGGEASVPRRSRGHDGDFHHILVRGEGAAKKLKGIREELSRGTAYFPFEAACHSEDPTSASCGGGIDEVELQAMLGTTPELDPGEVSEILESKRGFHLVWRPRSD